MPRSRLSAPYLAIVLMLSACQREEAAPSVDTRVNEPAEPVGAVPVAQPAEPLASDAAAAESGAAEQNPAI